MRLPARAFYRRSGEVTLYLCAGGDRLMLLLCLTGFSMTAAQTAAEFIHAAGQINTAV